MSVKEPRFLVIDLHKNKAVLATTDEMQTLLRRDEPLTGEVHFQRMESSHDPETSATEHPLPGL